MELQQISNASPSISEPASTAVEKKRRGAAWEAWEDRALAKQVIADDPILSRAGRKEDRWKEVAENLKKLVGIDRSWSSCKDRMDKLVSWQKKNETRSKQKTGAVEEVDEHVRNMTDIVLMYDSISQDKRIRHDAKGKIASRKERGKGLRMASKTGMVRKRDVLDTSPEEGESSEPHRKAPKNHFANEVNSVVKGLHDKADEFREAIREKQERDKLNSEQQQALNTKLDDLIESTKSTNEMIQNLMNVFIQGALRQPQPQ